MPADILSKFMSSLNNEGVSAALGKVARYVSPSSIARRRQYRDMLRIADSKARFEEIYAKNLWQDPDSGSGTGSNLAATANLRAALPGLFARYNVKTVLDVPCGDFFWMNTVMKELPNINYIGGDIVNSVIQSNIDKYQVGHVRFDQIDLTSSKLPDADLIIVRDCLFHLSYEDIAKVKRNLKKSNIKYILTTTHIVGADFSNQDIVTGDFRFINIFSEPLSFSAPVLERISDHAVNDPPREMCLMEVAQI